MSASVLIGAVFVLLVASALLTVLVGDVLATTVGFAGYSLALSILWVLLDAPDVGLTEAAVGAGLLSVLFLGVIARTDRTSGGKDRTSDLRLPSLVVVAGFVIGVALTVPALPEVGDPTTPAHTHLAPYYLGATPSDTGVSNVVTAILTTYRGFDTLGEVAVVFTAGIGVLVVLGRTSGFRPAPRVRPAGEDPSDLVGTGVRIVAPFVATLGLFVAFHGASSAGGGFQGGVIVGAAVVLVALGTDLGRAARWIEGPVFAVVTVGGIAAFVVLGLATMALGGRVLEYGVLPVEGATTYAIELVEIGIAATVSGTVLVYFSSLVGGAGGSVDSSAGEDPP